MEATDRLGAVTGRIERLERENRRLRWTGVAVAAGLLVLFLLVVGRPVSHVVEAQRFVLRDSRGAMRGLLAVTGAAEMPLLGLYDGDSRPRAEIGVGGDNAVSVRLFDPRGGRRLALRVDPAGAASWHLVDEDGRTLAGLEARPNNDVSLVLRRQEAGLVVFSSDIHQMMSVQDRDGQVHGTLGMYFAAQPRLVFSGEGGKLMWRSP